MYSTKNTFSSLTFFTLVSIFIFANTSSVIAKNVKLVESKSGIRALLMSDHTNPVITVSLAFKGGAALDPIGKEGLAYLASKTIDEGAGPFTGIDFQKKLEDLLIQLRFDASRDVFSGQLKTLTNSRDIAFKLLRLAITEPRFDLEPLNRISSQLLVRLKRESENPKKIAGKTLFKSLYPNHAYGRQTRGTAGSLKKIKQIDLKQFVRRRLAKNNLFLGVVGDINETDLINLLEATFSTLPKDSISGAVPMVEPQIQRETIWITKPVSQSTILMASRGIKRNSPMFYPAIVLNHIFGGGTFTSRLYNQVREKRGLAYSVGSYLLPLEKSAITLISVGTKSNQTESVIGLIKNEINTLSKTGVTQDELADAKKYLTGSFPLRFLSSEKIASMLVNIQLEGLGIEFLENRNKLINEISLQSINELASKIMDPDKLLTVVVGAK